MYTFGDVLQNFFTHKDFLPPADVWLGTLFTPLQIGFCAVIAVLIGWAALRCSQKDEAYQKRVFLVLWIIMVVSELAIDYYDCCTGKAFFVDWTSILPLWHCSIFMYTAPFAIFGNGRMKTAACGYICTLGLLGGLINFVYPASYLSYYSCISLAGFRTIFYHGAMIFTAATMLLSGYHSYKGAAKWQDLLLPAIPALIVSIPAIAANFLIPGADYMFFKLESFFFTPIGQALPDGVTIPVVFVLLLIVHGAPYLPSYLKNRKGIAAGPEEPQLQEIA